VACGTRRGAGDALLAPRARDLAARDYKRYMKVQRSLSPASVNQALAGMDHLFRFLGLGAAIVRREVLPRAAPRALDVEQQQLLLQAAEESTGRVIARSSRCCCSPGFGCPRRQRQARAAAQARCRAVGPRRDPSEPPYGAGAVRVSSFWGSEPR
jgi:hypothetical protein